MDRVGLHLRLTTLLRHRIRAVTGAEHLPAAGPYIVAINHISYIDPPIIGTVLLHERRVLPWFLTKPEVVRGFGKRLSSWLHMIGIDPANRAASLEHARMHLQQGRVIGIFPEGKRNPSDTLLPGKTGVARLVLAADVPVIPIGYIGPPGRSTAEAMRNLMLTRKPIEVHIGPPLQFADYQGQLITRELLSDVTDTIMKRIAVLCHKRFTPHDAAV